MGDLYLVSTAFAAIDQVTAPTEVSTDIDGDPRPLGSASDVGADEYGDPPPENVLDLRVRQAITTTGNVTITLGWSTPSGAESQTIRYSSNRISESNWDSAALLTDSLCGCAEEYQALVPYNGGTLYFSQRSYNTAGGWSGVSNNAFWPVHDIYLPTILR